jgi:hypothetical protein
MANLLLAGRASLGAAELAWLSPPRGDEVEFDRVSLELDELQLAARTATATHPPMSGVLTRDILTHPAHTVVARPPGYPCLAVNVTRHRLTGRPRQDLRHSAANAALSSSHDDPAHAKALIRQGGSGASREKFVAQ